MTTLNRSDAQQRADAIGVFNSELQRLEDEQVLQLSEPQRSRLQAHQQALLAQYRAAFDIDQNNQARQLSLGMRIASFLGALALAASVFFLFYQFWGLFGEVAQVAILIGASLLSLGLTLAVQQRDSSGRLGQQMGSKLSALVAFACFVQRQPAVIWLNHHRATPRQFRLLQQADGAGGLCLLCAEHRHARADLQYHAVR